MKEELKDARIKTLYYATLIQLAEQELGIDIEKKSATAPAFFDLLAANRLLIRRRRRKVITTFSRHRFRKYPNLIKGLVVDRPNQLWVVNITYWFTQYGCIYISLVTDASSKRIMGYAVAPNLQAVNCRNALQMALEQIGREAGKYLIHHRAGGPVGSRNSILQWGVRGLVRLLPCTDQHDGKG